MKPSLVAGAVVAALAVLPSGRAQEVRKTEKITVTASPLDRGEAEMAQPTTVLGEDELRRKRAASIGDTLGQETGVHSSAFGAAAGRPVIRGMDGPRVRVLENGIGTGDASSVSPDHAVATESLRAEQIEILRGPASLLYGSGAIGGVVNVVSKLVPREAPSRTGGDFEARGASGNRERTASASLEGGTAPVAWHLDGYRRRTADYDIPGGRLANSDVDARGGGAGASWVGSRGHAGAGVQRLESDYGIPTGEGVRIRMRQDRVEASAEAADPFAGFSRLRFRAGRNDYRHDEIEAGGELGTRFENRATEARLELRHGGTLAGTIGAQWQDQTLSASGEEAILPRTRSRAAALFVVEEMKRGAWTADAGLRLERETRSPEGDLPARRFTLATPAVGLVLDLGGGHRLAFAATQAQRAPSVEELYSHGAHHATATFDIGDPRLRKEVSRNVDVTLRQGSGEVRWKLNAYASRVRDYVFAAAQDLDGDGIADRIGEEGELDPAGEFLVQRFSQGRARFHGLEAEWAWRPAGGNGALRVFGDLTRARLADGSRLPRIAPARVGATAEWSGASWSGSVTALRAFAQKRTAPLETPTPGYTRVDAEASWKVAAFGSAMTIFLQATNLLDEEIRLHTSHLKDVAPQMGRSFAFGVRAEF